MTQAKGRVVEGAAPAEEEATVYPPYRVTVPDATPVPPRPPAGFVPLVAAAAAAATAAAPAPAAAAAPHPAGH